MGFWCLIEPLKKVRGKRETRLTHTQDDISGLAKCRAIGRPHKSKETSYPIFFLFPTWIRHRYVDVDVWNTWRWTTKWKREEKHGTRKHTHTRTHTGGSVNSIWRRMTGWRQHMIVEWGKEKDETVTEHLKTKPGR